MPETLSRISRFADLTGGVDLAIVMLLSAPPAIVTAKALTAPRTDNVEGVYAYARLQAELLILPDLPNIPVLLLANIDGLVDLLQSHAAAIGAPQREMTTSNVTAEDLLNCCTTEPPLPPLAVGLITDIFPSLGALAAEATAMKGFMEESEQGKGGGDVAGSSELGDLREEMQPGLEALRGQMGDEVVRGLVDFWDEEWAID